MGLVTFTVTLLTLINTASAFYQQYRIADNFCSDKSTPSFFGADKLYVADFAHALVPFNVTKYDLDLSRSESLNELTQSEISLWEYIYERKGLFITMVVITGINLIAIVLVCPYACVRKCCRFCKKDHTRSDYRKSEKMRPAIWYLVMSALLFFLALWSLYSVC
jgi:hypothetical protein